MAFSARRVPPVEGRGRGSVVFFLLLYFSFPDSIVVDATQTKTGDGAQKRKVVARGETRWLLLGRKVGQRLAFRDPMFQFAIIFFFFFLSELVVCLLCDVRKLASAAQVLWASKNSL